MLEKKEVTFNIEGKFITQLAREWMFYEGREFEKVMDLLLSCMCGTNQSEKTLRRFAEDVLLGRAELSGNTAEGTFCLTTYNADEQPDVLDGFNIFGRYSEEIRKRKETEEEKEKYMEWYEIAMEYIPEYLKNEVRRRTGQSVKNPYNSDNLAGFMERMTDKEEHSTEDYGWLSPDGTFYEVEWGNHQQWAEKYIRTNMTEEQWLEAGIHEKGKFQSASYNTFGDWLVERGWVLLHSPSQGIAFPTRNPLKRYTKAQQEFLYDYYMERRKEKEANAIYGDDL